MNREDLIAELAAIERALADRVVIVREIIDVDRRVLFEIRKTVLLPRDNKQPRR